MSDINTTEAEVEVLVIGKMRVARLPEGKVWLQHASGEGMETSEQRLSAWLELFWQKEF